MALELVQSASPALTGPATGRAGGRPARTRRFALCQESLFYVLCFVRTF